MRRTMVASLAVALAVGVLGASSAGAQTGALATPTAVPDGWVLLDAQAPVAVVTGRPYYARSATSGPALAFQTLSCDGGCDEMKGTRRRVSALPSGQLVRSGRWAWLVWGEPANLDTAYAVVARDLPDRAVIAAALAAKVAAGKVRRIGDKGLPAGFRKLGAFDVALWGIPFGAERVTIGHSDDRSVVDAYTYRYDSPAARAAQRFWSEQALQMAGSPVMSLPALSVLGPGPTGAHPVLVEVGDRAVVLVGTPDDAALRELGSSFRDVDDAQWEAFRTHVVERV